MKYECYMCLWTTHIKTKMVYHMGRIRPCKNINIINIDDCKQYILNGLSYKEYLEIVNSPQKNTNIPQKATMIRPITTMHKPTTTTQ